MSTSYPRAVAVVSSGDISLFSPTKKPLAVLGLVPPLLGDWVTEAAAFKDAFPISEYIRPDQVNLAKPSRPFISRYRVKNETGEPLSLALQSRFHALAPPPDIYTPDRYPHFPSSSVSWRGILPPRASVQFAIGSTVDAYFEVRAEGGPWRKIPNMRPLAGSRSAFRELSGP